MSNAAVLATTGAAVAVQQYAPSLPQMEFLRAKARYVAYGGARGGGKSWVIRLKAKLLALRYPGIKILIVRQTFRELDNNHIQPLLESLRGLARYNRQDKCFRFRNGSTISFLYCASDGDLEMYQGSEWDVIMIDESTNLREEWLAKIDTCCRGTGPYPRRTYFCCNPGGVSHAWHKRLFVDRRFGPDECPDDYVFIQAKVTDNHALMAAQPEYLRQLQNLPPKLRAAWLEGSWDIFEGAVFEELRIEPTPDRRWTHVIPAEGFRVQSGWEVYRSYDHGYRRPFACTYYTIDYDGVMYLIAEFYGCQRDTRTGESIPNEGLKYDPDRIFRDMAEFERTHPLLAGHNITGVADPAIWNKEPGVSVAEHAADHGIYFVPANHNRLHGLMQCHYRLQFDAEGYPRMYVLDSCKDFIRTIPQLQYDQHKVEDVDTEGEDHIYDSWRYFCAQHVIKPMAADPKYVPQADPLDMFTTY